MMLRVQSIVAAAAGMLWFCFPLAVGGCTDAGDVAGDPHRPAVEQGRKPGPEEGGRWKAVAVLKRFFEENDPNGVRVCMMTTYGKAGWGFCGYGDEVRIVRAVLEDCRARDAEIDTMGGAVQPIHVGVVLQGRRYAIFFGLDTSGGCRMGGSQYRWRGTRPEGVIGAAGE